MGDVSELAESVGIGVLVLAEGLPGQWCALSLAADSPFLSMVTLTALEILAIPASSSLLLTVV